MPWIIDYTIVLEHMRSQRFKCRYYNSGAFAFVEEAITIGWIGPPDASILPAARAVAHQVPEPFAENLARLLRKVWLAHLTGRVWVMPMSHWAFELTHANGEWMPRLIESIDLDPGLLEGRNNAAAIEFSPEEAAAFSLFTERLLQQLRGSDFMIAFPGKQALCMLHHHTQLWWTVKDPALAAAIVAVIDGDVAPGEAADAKAAAREAAARKDAARKDTATDKAAD